MGVSVCMCRMCMGAWNGQEEVLDPLGSELQVVVSCQMWVVETDAGPLEEQYTSNRWATSPNFHYYVTYFLVCVGVPQLACGGQRKTSGSLFSFDHVGSREWTQIRLVYKHLYFLILTKTYTSSSSPPPKLIIVCIFKVNFICVCVGVHKQVYAGTHTYLYAWRWKEGADSFDSGSYPCTWDSFSLLDWKSANSRNLPVSAALPTWSWGYRCLWGCPCYMGDRNSSPQDCGPSTPFKHWHLSSFYSFFFFHLAFF